MKKMKKFLAMMLAMAMVMGLSLTAFAVEGTAGITVKGLTKNDNTTLKIYQIVYFDQADSEWKPTATKYSGYLDFSTEPVTVNWKEIQKIVTDEDVYTDAQTTIDQAKGEAVFSNLPIGLYMITASGDKTEYTVMGTDTANFAENGTLTGLLAPEDDTIYAKGSNYTVLKTLSNSGQTYVAKGETVEFDINTVFPSYADDAESRTFTITDTPTGMKITNIQVFMNGSETALDAVNYSLIHVPAEGEASQVTLPSSEAVTVSFNPNYIGMSNTHAAETVRVHVTAVITSNDGVYSNSASSDKSSTPSTVEGTSGSITINKQDEDGAALTGARFSVTLQGETTAKEFVLLSETNGTATYTLKTTDTVIPEGVTQNSDLKVVGTDTASIIKLEGLGAGVYTIEETQAPAGYSLKPLALEGNVDENGNIIPVTLESTNPDGTRTIRDTQLSSLPSTGGIGTTIFTVGGCAIMIIAAGLYFSLRRKSAK